VTICIAAVCQHNNKPRIVLCTDWRGETYLGASETSDKRRLLPNGWVALLAGDLNRAEELVALYESHLATKDSFADDNELFSFMKRPTETYKESLADSYIRQSLGISYREFLDRADKLPAEIVSAKLNEIDRIKLNAALILCGFIRTSSEGSANPYLFVVEDEDNHSNVVRVEDNFAAIGSGAYVAIPSLHQREHDSEKSLMETLYAVFEAKELSRVVPGIGAATSIDVMDADAAKPMLWSITEAGYEHCSALFRKLGPKLDLSERMSERLFAFDAAYLEPFDDEAEKVFEASKQPSAAQKSEGQQ
jgi:ATP-dependent protease HslVU (ClpYQ) peptidase subunit